MKEAPQTHSLSYFLSSLGGTARALEDFGYHDEAAELFGVQRAPEDKASPAKKE